jgi:hypothetical protein
MPTPPVALTLLACDRATRTRGRGGYDLTGMFHALNLMLPTTLTFAVYYVVTECHGSAELDLMLLSPDDERLGGGAVVVPPADPLSIVEGVGMFNGVPIGKPGTYRLRIECGGEVLAERPILIGPGV